MTKPNSNTRELGDLIEAEFIQSGSGQLDVLIDDIIERFRDHLGRSTTSTAYAGSLVHRRLAHALQYLWELKGWLGVPVTAFFFANFANRTPRDIQAADVTEAEIKASVAGLGRAQARVGFHFIADKDDWLFIYHTAHGVKNGHGKVRANVGRAVEVAEIGNLSPEGAQGIDELTNGVVKDTKGQLKALRAKVS